MTPYKEIHAIAEGSTPQERIMAILEKAGIAIRISSWEDVTITMVYDGFVIVDEDAAYMDMLNPDIYGSHTPLSGPNE